MNRNAELHFAELPDIKVGRSKFKRPSTHKMTANVGDLNVCYCDEILPGDTVSMDMSSLLRMATPVFPVMDDLYCDFYWFFVPRRLTWEHWKNFIGENDTDYWTESTTYTVPQVSAPSNTGWIKGTIADQMGIPIGVDGFTVDAAMFKGYAQIVNDWFRDQNVQEPCLINRGDSTLTGSNGTDYATDCELGGMPFKAAKLRDYFTTVLPQPQKGIDVPLPLGDLAPVYPTVGTDEDIHDIPDAAGLCWAKWDSVNQKWIRNPSATGLNITPGSTDAYTAGGGATGAVSGVYAPSNLWADLSLATGSSVNQLRTCFQLQRFAEKDARNGTRINEMLRSHWGIISSDARLQRAEYLGGDRFRINMSQVVQTSETGTSPQGHVSAYSLTTSQGHMFTRSFEEWGHIYCLFVMRARHSYQQGLEKMFSRKTKFDFYWPEFANLGDMAVLNKEIYLQGNDEDEEVFGYQEAWGDYRYKPSIITGELRSTYAAPLDAWHYGDYYTMLPTYSSDWIKEPKTLVDRTLAVTSQDQFICDFAFTPTFVRAMPVYSIPGLIDHQ